MTTQVTTIGTIGTMRAAWRPSLEELVDRPQAGAWAWAA